VAQREFEHNGLVRRNVGSGVEELELEIPTFLMNACRRNKGINKK
jgi:hypothetical protein